MRDLAPRLAENDSVDRCSVNSEPFSEGHLSSPHRSQRADQIGFLLGQLGSRATPDVDRMGNCFDVVWTNAGCVSAQVVKFHSYGNGAIDAFPVDAMGNSVSAQSFVKRQSVSISAFASVPHMARSLVAAVDDVIGRFIAYSVPPLASTSMSYCVAFAHKLTTTAFAKIELHVGSSRESMLHGCGFHARTLNFTPLGGRV